MKHVLLSLGGLCIGSALFAQTGAALEYIKISQTSGNFNAELTNQGKFGFVSALGSNRVLSGAPFSGNGEVHILMLHSDGSVASQSVIRADDYSIFQGVSDAAFGSSSLAPGDVNGDGAPDFIVGAPGYGSAGALIAMLSNGEGFDAAPILLPESLLIEGARWGDHLTMKGNRFFAGLQSGAGKVVEFTVNGALQANVIHVYDETTEALSSLLDAGDRFGTGVAVADLNGDGIDDILCGAPGDDDGGSNYGAVYQLYRNANGEVTNVVKLSATQGNFNGFLNSNDEFGISIVPLGDLDGDGHPDIAVGAPGDDDGNIDVGAVWIIFLRGDGQMRLQRKINLMEGNFHQSGLAFDDRFGTRLASIGDINNDGTIDLAIGAPQKDDGGNNRGAFYTVMIEYCQVPTAIFEYEAEGTTVQFSIPGGPGFTYIWNFPGGGYSQQQNPVHTFANAGTHMVCLLINGPCAGNSYCGPVQVSSSLSAHSGTKGQLQVYPNPASDIIRVKSPEPMASASLVDMTGTLVWQGQIGATEAKIQLGHLPKGLYILSLITENGVVAHKVQVM